MIKDVATHERYPDEVVWLLSPVGKIPCLHDWEGVFVYRGCRIMSLSIYYVLAWKISARDRVKRPILLSTWSQRFHGTQN